MSDTLKAILMVVMGWVGIGSIWAIVDTIKSSIKYRTWDRQDTIMAIFFGPPLIGGLGFLILSGIAGVAWLCGWI